MNSTEKVLLQLTGRALFAAETDFNPADVDWMALYSESSNQALTILIWDVLSDEERAYLPKELSLRWKKNVMLRIMHNEQLRTEQDRIIKLFSDADIPCVVLKGSSSAFYYPNPSLRLMGDIDLLVKPENQLEAVKILQKYGYGEVINKNHHCHMTVCKGKFTVEIHKEINGLSLNENSESLQKIREYFDNAVECRQTIDNLPVLSDDRQAISLILHKLGHFLTGGLGLRQMCDWAMFVNRVLDKSRWERLKPKLSEFGILYFTGIVTKACVDYLRLPEAAAPWASGYDDQTTRLVIEQILSEGNFGVKADKYGERLFSNPNAKNRFTSFFKVLISACREHYPACERYPVLIPAAPFVLLGRYLLQRGRGERPKLNLLQKYRRSGADRELYKSLKPFVK